MTEAQIHGDYAEHDIVLNAPPSRVFDLIADVRRWPLMFSPCVHAEILDRGPDSDRIRLWARTGDSVRSWTSRRTLNEAATRVDFEQENSKPPLAAMGGHWRVDGERLVLAHHWALTDPTPQSEKWASDVLDANSNAETAAVREWAEYGDDFDDIVFSFSDEVAIPAKAQAVYDFLHRSDLWPERLPHVVSLNLQTDAASEAAGGVEVQTMTMETRAHDGGAHTTRSIRLCWPHERILYKQTVVPHGLQAHTGEWLIVPDENGVRVQATHRVALDPKQIEDTFGAGTTLAQARTKTAELLRRNSIATLGRALEFLT
ncbi:aromatase/cyclase [Amycolatopsis palatopharyngis]|uniref:aromatase/cyclase n=1 Tax=Amycolatopsis palatopharyngis TaxID=187982 RepID=UPI000E289303|nr:aromatase/cyclase [Amycolatopsis palatopharyngis]